MTPASDGPNSLLLQIAEADIQTARAMIRSRSDADFVALADEAERLAVGDTGMALRATARLQTLADEAGDPASRARVRRARGQALAYANRYEEAIEVLEQAREIAGGAAPLEAARAGVAMIHALARLGRLRDASDVGTVAHLELSRLGERVLAARADVNLGVVCRMLDRPGEAIEHFDRALPVFADNAVVSAQVQSNRGEALLDLGDFAGAEGAFTEALRTFEQLGARRAASIAEGNLADLLSRQGRYGRALHHFERARERLQQDCAPADAARLAVEQAEAQFAVGLLQQSARTYEEALPVLESHGLAAESARARVGRAKVLSVLGEVPAAVALAEQGRLDYLRIEQPVPAARAGLVLGQLRLMQGQADAGVDQIREAMRTLCDRPADLAHAHALLAGAALNAGDLRAALVETGAALHFAESSGLVSLVPHIRNVRGRAFGRLGMLAEAAHELGAAADEVARLRGTLSVDRFRAVFASTHGEILSDAVGAYLAIGGGDALRRAFSLVQVAKSASLLDVLGEEESIEQKSTFAEVQQAMLRLRALVHQAFEGQESAPGARDLTERILSAERELDDAFARTAARAEYRELTSSPVPITDILRAIPPGWALIEYHLVGERLGAFLLLDGDIRHFWVAAVGDVVRESERLQFQVSHAVARTSAGVDPPDASGMRRTLERLFQLTLEPLWHLLTDSAGLIVAPAGPLHSIPFHALAKEGAHLCERIPTLQVPSASLLVHLHGRRARGQAGGPPLVVAAPDEHAPGIAAEAAALAALMPGSRVLLGAEADPEVLRRECAGRGLVHFACHGAFSPGLSSAGLKLGTGWMTGRELASLPLEGAIVALSGCETGRLDVAAGDEISGLLRSLLAARAVAVLATLWPTHDRINAELIGKVYNLWYSDGASGARGLATALQRVRTESIKAGVHPAFWSPFVVIGPP